MWGIHRSPVNSPHKWPATRKMFPFDDVIMEFHCLLRLLFFRLTSKCTCNRRSQTQWRHRWRNQDENTFSSTSVIWSFHTWCQIETMLNVLKFSKLTKFRYSVRLFRWKCHRKWVCCSDSQGHYLHFELLIGSSRLKSSRVMTISKFYLFFTLVIWHVTLKNGRVLY